MSPYDDPAVSAGEIAEYLDQLHECIHPKTDSPNDGARLHQPEHEPYLVAQEDPMK